MCLIWAFRVRIRTDNQVTVGQVRVAGERSAQWSLADLSEAQISPSAVSRELWIVDNEKVVRQVKQLTKIGWHLICSPIHLRLLGQCLLKPCLRTGYFLLRSSGHMMETCQLLSEGSGALVTPVKAIRVGVGL